MVSISSGPIPPHPYYDTSDPQRHTDVAIPRVRPEAQTYYQQGQGTVGMVLKIEGQRVPSGYSSRSSAQPRDHVAENVRRMRRIQRETKKKDEQSHEPMKALWKSSKYETVGSRIKESMDKKPPAPRPSSANFLRAHSRSGYYPQSARAPSTEPPEEKLTVPKAMSAREVKFVRRDIDFIKHNGMGARNVSMRRSPSLTQLDDLKKKKDEEEINYKKGQVPTYLQKRQHQWEADEKQRIANIPDPEMPPGHRLLPDGERRNTLDKLQETQSELTRQLATLPIRTDTLRLRTRKETIDTKMAEVEQAIKIFSRPKVFVKLDT